MTLKDWKLTEGDYYWENKNKYLTITQDESTQSDSNYVLVMGIKTSKRQKIIKYIDGNYQKAKLVAKAYMRKH